MRRVNLGLLAGLLAWAGFGAAQEPPAGPEPACEREEKDVRTWTMNIGDRLYEVHPATPSYEGTTGLFHLPSAYVLPKRKVSVSLFRDNLDRDPKDEDVSIHGVTLAYGLTDRFELYGNLGLQNRVNADALGQAGFVNDYPFVNTSWQTGLGNARLGLKYQFLDDYRGDGVALAVRGFVGLPTADEQKGLGTGKASYGADLILSKSLGGSADLHGSIGMQWNGDPDTVDIGNAFKWGLGLNVPACRSLQVQAELLGTRYGDADFEQTNPLDLVVGPVFWLKPGVFVRAALSWNLNFDDRGLNSGSASKMGRQFSIGFHPGTACCAVKLPPPPPPPPPANRPPTVACRAEQATASPGEVVRFTASGSDPDGDALSYSWTASAGRISGGESASLDTTGLTASSVSATVRCSDSRGATAEATCSVRLDAVEPPPPATTSCESSGFPRNLARLNNVDKACLDDLASRLRQDPRSRVIVIGHADAGERLPEVLARKRAEAAKQYLVGERQIEASRISVRSAASSRPADPGTSVQSRSRNRRIELIFVPEGATAPEPD